MTHNWTSIPDSLALYCPGCGAYKSLVALQMPSKPDDPCDGRLLMGYSPQAKTYNATTIKATFKGEPIGGLVDVAYDIQFESQVKCECGAKKLGVKDFAPGHSSWCAVVKKP